MDTTNCPDCGGPMKEMLPSFPGSFVCDNGDVCPGVRLSDLAARALHEEICRQMGMTADQIVEQWNALSPEDPW